MISQYQFNNNFDGDIRLNLATNFDTVSKTPNRYVSSYFASNYNVTYTLRNKPSNYSESLVDQRSKYLLISH